MLGFLKKIFIGDVNAKEIKRMQETVDKINSFEPQLQSLSDTKLSNKTSEFKWRLSQGESLDDLLPEAFAVVREASRRVLNMRHFDEQMMGGMALHEGNIAEMRTGEGKTLVATLAVYLNALSGEGVHVVTVNDYLAKRDSAWMGQIYKFLGLSVGLIEHGMDFPERKGAYAADITYGTNNEFGFDYLRDNMVIYKEQMVQRPLKYAIVDEVDSILIDEARTPLVISGPGERSTGMYNVLAQVVKKLNIDEDYKVDEKMRNVAPTEAGIAKLEKILNINNLFDGDNIEVTHLLNQALRAKELMKRDRDYVVKEGEIVIVDEFTGRMMFGRRYSDGLHQSIEAKEGVTVERESQTLAAITFQNYFRMYEKLGGMTGTAKTEEQEFQSIYNLEVVCIPTHRDMVRDDLADVVYKNKEAKYKAVVNEIATRHANGQPVLVGTTSIVQSEELSERLKKRGIAHSVLNAKHHEKEAEIISKAGVKNAVTIATNMAGRGTDIVLGEGVIEIGGLHIIGTERHESRRIDNQLRGRAGRQGDPGSSRFYLSLEDDLMRLFGSDSISNIMDKLGMDENDPIEHTMVTKSIETAQKKVENHNFSIRKYVLEYDDVMNQQREVIYEQRKKILNEERLLENIKMMIAKIVERVFESYAPKEVYPEEWDLDAMIKHAEEYFMPPGRFERNHFEQFSREELLEELQRIADENYAYREDLIGLETMRELEKVIMLKIVDQKWMEHLDNMDMLREGIGLRAYGQKDPLTEYKFEAFDMFSAMQEAIQDDIVRYIYKMSFVTQPQLDDRLVDAQANYVSEPGVEHDDKKKPIVKKQDVGRNDNCPCGSGSKYKNCCGKNK